MTYQLQPTTGKHDCLYCFEALRDQWAAHASVFRDKNVGYRGGGHVCTLYWRSKERVWGLFGISANRKRYWIGWGTKHPAGSFDIIVETNPPVEGYDRRCAGAFLRDDLGRAYLAHSGRVGGGRVGIGKKAFRSFTDLEHWVTVRWPDRKQSEYLLLDQISGDDFPTRITAFVHEVARFKEWAVRR